MTDPIVSMPLPHPKSAISFPSMSPKRDSIVWRAWAENNRWT